MGAAIFMATRVRTLMQWPLKCLTETELFAMKSNRKLLFCSAFLAGSLAAEGILDNQGCFNEPVQNGQAEAAPIDRSGIYSAARLCVLCAFNQPAQNAHAEGPGQLTDELHDDSISVPKVAAPAAEETAHEATLTGPDAHEMEPSNGQLFGNWGGLRTRFKEHGVKFDVHLISDSLWNIKSQQNGRFASNDRVRGTVDMDLGTLINQQGWYFHMTPVWQGGGNLGSDLGLIANPSSLVGMNAFRLDSWWFEKTWLKDRLSARAGQFAADDSYGDPNFGGSFVFAPMGGSIDNLFNTYESFDPPSTSALEIHVVPVRHFYVKSMILSMDRLPFTNNETGLVPRFHGPSVGVSEIGFTPGGNASTIVPADTLATRKGYRGLYQFGAAYNPGKFAAPLSAAPRSGNYLLYWKASQAVWRANPKQQSNGLDATLAYDWSPADINRNNKMLIAGLRYDEPLPFKIHNTISIGYVQNDLSAQFRPAVSLWHAERGVELNVLLNVLPMIILQPVVQFYSNDGGGAQNAVVFGFRTKIEF
jgi:carbohydrate-selective porin OprB